MIAKLTSRGGRTSRVLLRLGRYNKGGLAVQAYEPDGQLYCTLSVNLPETGALPPVWFYAKHWSENEGFVEQLVSQGLIQEVPAPAATSGHVLNIRAYRLSCAHN